MEDSTRNRLTRMLLSKDRRARYIRLFVCLGLCVVVVVAVALHQNGVAMVHEEKVLSCPVTAKVAHTHDESCYDKDGNLVCPLPELKLHTHTKDCYDKDGKLVCDLPEVELHTHTDACYTDVRKLTCGKEESDEHQHTDACYTVTGRELTCGKEEITENHVHGPGCFTTILVPNDEENAAADAAANEPQTAEGVTTNDASSALEGQATVQDGAQDGTAGTTADATQSDAQTDQQASNVAADAQNNNNANTDAQAAADAQANVDANAQSTTEAQTGTESQTNAQDQNATATDEQKATDEPAKTETPAKDETKTETPAKEETKSETTKTEEQTDVKTDDQSKDAAAATVQKQEEARPAQEFEQKILGKDGGVWMVVSVKAPEGAFPAGTTMKATAVEAKNVTAAVGDAVSKKTNSKVTGLAAVDITFYDANGKEIEPAKQIEVKLTNDLVSSKGDVYVVHVDDKGKGGVVNTNSKKNDQLTFGADSFSTYVIATTTLEEVVLASDGRNYRITVTCDEESGIPADARLEVHEIAPDEPATDGATEYEKLVARTEDDLGLEPGQINYARFFDIDILDAEGNKIQPAEGSTVGVQIVLDDLQEGTQSAADTQVVHFAEEQTEVLSSDVIGESVNFEAASFSVYAIIEALPQPDEAGNIEGSYAIAYCLDTTDAVALTPVAYDATYLKSTTDLTIRPSVTGDNSIMLEAKERLTMWKIQKAADDAGYKISTGEDENEQYLRVNGAKLTLTYDSAAATEFTAFAGEGANAGKFKFVTANNYALELVEKTEKYKMTKRDKFGVTKKVDSATCWLNLVGNEDIEITYTSFKATKKSVAELANSDTVVIYTRVWNTAENKYDFYIVNYDGALIKCYTSGDVIQWYDSALCKPYWKFSEYYYEGTQTPNGYYDFKNTYVSEGEPAFLAPKIESNGAPLSVGTNQATGGVGVNLDGRSKGKDYTTILAWDDPYYAYAGIKVKEPEEDGGVYRIVSCRSSEADDFYFAIPQDSQQNAGQPTQLTEVPTIDNNMYGIEMWMVDFNGPKYPGLNREKGQYEFFGSYGIGDKAYNEDVSGLLSSYMENHKGYPTTTSKTNTQGNNNEGRSLYELYNRTGISADKRLTRVNNLFLKSIHDESGYFEYDSTQNFASLGDDGHFTVYEQLGCVGDSTKPSRLHGQFMPYNTIDIKNPAPANVTNQTNVLTQELSDLDPRKGETMYKINYNKDPSNGNKNNGSDYFFGMEMTATFTQTEDGLDDWGHDIIFEFSGDDDFWLYVDGELVLDLGGVHPAMTGYVNFRTGEVHVGGGNNTRDVNTTLYELFKEHYKEVGRNIDDVQAKLDFVFKQNKEGNYVFKDYTDHDMRVFYMERGESASNLHMRFNLAAIRPGTVQLSKEISGVSDTESVNDKFAYQVYYATEEHDGTPIYNLLGEKDEKGNYNVTHVGTTQNAEFAQTYTQTEGATSYTYEKVFLIKQGDTVEIKLPENTISYKIVECGVDTKIYDTVKVNKTEIVGTSATTGAATASNALKDFAFEDSPDATKRIVFNNHVKEDALGTLTFTKLVFADASSNDPVTADGTNFKFRLSLGKETPVLVNKGKYYVKDPDGNYCKWVYGRGFVSLGVKTYEALAELARKQQNPNMTDIVFETSASGAIDKIPAGYSVEVRNVPIGTKYVVEERDEEIPDGYQLIGYRVNPESGNQYTVGRVSSATGEIAQNKKDQLVEVHNQGGWGITAHKVWSDDDYMSSHDPIYFAVYIKKDNDRLELVENTVHQVNITEEDGSVSHDTKWYFNKLQAGTQFSQYVVREVEIKDKNIRVDDDGLVSSLHESLVNPVDSGESILIDATRKVPNTSQKKQYTYTVTYGETQTSSDDHVKEFTVTNSRSGGIKILKQTWGGDPLNGATFTLKDAKNADLGMEVYTSRKVGSEEGFVTMAYLPEDLDDGTYTLEETKTPKGYAGLKSAITLRVAKENDEIYNVYINGGSNTVETDTNSTKTVVYVDELQNASDAQSDEIMIPQDSNGMRTVIIKNRPLSLSVLKTDEDGQPLSGATFSIYRQKMVGQTTKRDDAPIAGYNGIVSGKTGIVFDDLGKNLVQGTYYLVENSAPGNQYAIPDYLTLTGTGVIFTITDTGEVTLGSGHEAFVTLNGPVYSEDGTATYQIAVKNVKRTRRIQLIKVGTDNKELSGAEFDLYKQGQNNTPIHHLVSGENGVVFYSVGENATANELTLEQGTYNLVETKAPDGYVPNEKPIVITVTTSGSGSAVTCEYDDKPVDVTKKDGKYTIEVTNKTGYQLPTTGGVGTLPTYVAGVLLVAIALVMHHRMKTAKGV